MFLLQWAGPCPSLNYIHTVPSCLALPNPGNDLEYVHHQLTTPFNNFFLAIRCLNTSKTPPRNSPVSVGDIALDLVFQFQV